MEEKRTPTNHPHSVGGGLLKIRRCVKRNRILIPGTFRANPMPRKRKPPLTFTFESRWGLRIRGVGLICYSKQKS